MPRPARNLQDYTSGTPCKGKTISGKEIIGLYVQAGPNNTAYIRGVVAKNGRASPFDPLEIHKVTRESLRKT